MHAELFARAAPVKRTRQRKEPESEKAKAKRALFKSLVTAVYGEDPGHFAEGTWGVAASEIVRRNPAILQKFLSMQVRGATAKPQTWRLCSDWLGSHCSARGSLVCAWTGACAEGDGRPQFYA